ncbi:YceD family protein [Methylomagnum sp.]
MFDRLPELFDPLEFVEKKRRIKGIVPLGGLDRLHDALLNREDGVRVDLEFMREGRVAAVTGRVEATLVLQCQCCLEPMDWPVSSEVRLGVVTSIDQANLLPEDFEPLMVDPGAVIALADIVQDELLLAMPSVPQHSDCKLSKPDKASGGVEHPFAVLAQLKKNQS